MGQIFISYANAEAGFAGRLAEGDRKRVATVIVDDTGVDDIPFALRRLQAADPDDCRSGVGHASFEMPVHRARSILKTALRPPNPTRHLPHTRRGPA